MLTLFIVLQVIVAVFLILVVLLQPGNKGGAGAALGGAGGDTVFGGRGANTFLAKLTFGAAVLFMVTNFVLSFMSTPSSSVLDHYKNQPAQKPAVPAPAPQAPEAPAPAAPVEPAPAK